MIHNPSSYNRGEATDKHIISILKSVIISVREISAGNWVHHSRREKKKHFSGKARRTTADWPATIRLMDSSSLKNRPNRAE
jgi:hypothetical protein